MGTTRKATRAVVAVGVVLLGLRALVACGARTPLDVNPPRDAGKDVTRDALVQDVLPDIDAGFDAEPDVLPDVPMIDVNPLPDVVVQGCQDAGATQIYLITSQNILYSFYPPTLAITPIGMIACPDPDPSSTPFSMAVDRKGTAFSVFTDSQLFQVSTATAACISTPYVPDQQGITTFGMGYVGDFAVDAGETLYIASNSLSGTGSGPMSLATIDTSSFTVDVVGAFQPTSAELTGTGDGRLFAFWAPSNASPPSFISQIDPASAQVTATSPLPTVAQGDGWAFAFWGGSFYLFTGSSPTTSDITRFDPTDNSVTVVGTVQDLITGAGVSTCAPMQ